MTWIIKERHYMKLKKNKKKLSKFVREGGNCIKLIFNIFIKLWSRYANKTSEQRRRTGWPARTQTTPINGKENAFSLGQEKWLEALRKRRKYF